MYWVWGGTSTLLTPLVTLSNNQGPCGRRCMKLCLSFRFCVHLCTYNEIERLKNGKNNPNFWFPIAMLIWETKHTLIFSKFISFFLGSHARVLVQCGISQYIAYIRHEVKVRQVEDCTFILATHPMQGILLTLHPNVQKGYLKIKKLLLRFRNNNNPSYYSIYITILSGELKLFQIYKKIWKKTVSESRCNKILLNLKENILSQLATCFNWKCLSFPIIFSH